MILKVTQNLNEGIKALLINIVAIFKPLVSLQIN